MPIYNLIVQYIFQTTSAFLYFLDIFLYFLKVYNEKSSLVEKLENLPGESNKVRKKRRRV